MPLPQDKARHQHGNLAAAQADLPAEAATERRFDQLLGVIPFLPLISAVARALIQANERRVKLTWRQAGAASLAEMQSFTSCHRGRRRGP